MKKKFSNMQLENMNTLKLIHYFQILAFIGCIFFICGFYNYFTLAKKVEDDKIKYPNKYLPIVLTVVTLFAVYLIIDKEKLL